MNFYIIPGLIRPKKAQSTEVIASAIERIVGEYFNFTLDQIKKKCRKREVVVARQMCMFLMKKYTRFSFKTIGDRFAGKDHSTVIHACRQIQDLLDTDEGTRSDMEEILLKLQLEIPSVQPEQIVERKVAHFS